LGLIEKSDEMGRRCWYLLGLIALAMAVFHRPLWVVIGSSVSTDQYSQILVVPPLSACLLYIERKRLLAEVAYSKLGAVLYLLFVGVFVLLALQAEGMELSTYISLSILLFSGCCIAAFLFCFGLEALRRSAFPVFFLVLMTPFPDSLREKTIVFLQQNSAVLTDWFFTAARIPFVRDGVILTLPSVTIEIAQECSGIRSSMILVISGLVLGHLFLRSKWSKLVLLLLLVPITIIKNGFRIFSLTTLGMYVDRSFLTGPLHHKGGVVFFALSLMGLWLIVWVLQRLENKAEK
jgi:exosortase